MEATPMSWLKANLDKILAALTAILAIGDWQHLWHLEWLTALAAVLTLISEWLNQQTKPVGVVPPPQPQAKK
jgi:hypothetical protein